MASTAEQHPLRWNDDAWRAEAETWVRERIDELGRRLTGPIEQPHIRPWSTLFRIATDSGVVWFKAAIAPVAHETASLELLSARCPHAVPVFLAGDRSRGWMLVEDAGDRLRELDGGREPRRWEEWLAVYADVQIAAAADADAFAEGGCPDRRGARLAEQLASVLRDDRFLKPPTEAALRDDEIDALHGCVARLAGDAAALDALGVPPSIQHDDLHDANVFVLDGGYRIIDWGDACVASPLLSIELPIRVLCDRSGVDADAPDAIRLRDAYLEPFTAFAPRRELVAAWPTVRRAAVACNTVKWYEIAREIPAWTLGRFAEAIPTKLRTLLALCG